MQNLWYMDKFSHKKHALLLSLPPRGAWIEMLTGNQGSYLKHCRSPRGERGLKFPEPQKGPDVLLSLPPRGAWIEIV